jgi:hypothetical protein
VTIFTADGAYISVDAEGFLNHGDWEAIGERTAGLTIISPGMDAEAFAGKLAVRASIEVDQTGDSFTAQYAGEFVKPDGTETGSTAGGRSPARASPSRRWALPRDRSRSCSKGRQRPRRPRNQNAYQCGTAGSYPPVLLALTRTMIPLAVPHRTGAMCRRRHVQAPMAL